MSARDRELIDAMAAELRRQGATTERDAIRALMERFAYGQVAALADRALALALQPERRAAR